MHGLFFQSWNKSSTPMIPENGNLCWEVPLGMISGCGHLAQINPTLSVMMSPQHPFWSAAAMLPQRLHRKRHVTQLWLDSHTWLAIPPIKGLVFPALRGD